jgi:perosamine synthetase
MKIPVCEPFLNGREAEYVLDAVRTGWISSSGKYVTEFERSFAAYCGVRYGVAVCNGTVALHLALRAMGVGAGDEVIVPNFTMIASAFAVCYTGARPVFVDAARDSWNIDPRLIEQKITSRTKAIMPVHIYGLPCDMDALCRITGGSRITLVEDAAEAHGAAYKGQKAGALSAIAAFSFYANKNLTTGEGGMVITDDTDLWNRARYFKNLCFPLDAPRVYVHSDVGFNYRMSNIHAAIGLAQVERADEYLAMRRRNARLYRRLLSDVPGITFQSVPAEFEQDYSNSFWMNSLVVEPEKYGRTRDELAAYLESRGVETRLLFVGMHRQPSLSQFVSPSEHFPVSDWLSENGLYLPSASSLTEQQIGYVSDSIRSYHIL